MSRWGHSAGQGREVEPLTEFDHPVRHYDSSPASAIHQFTDAVQRLFDVIRRELHANRSLSPRLVAFRIEVVGGVRHRGLLLC